MGYQGQRGLRIALKKQRVRSLGRKMNNSHRTSRTRYVSNHSILKWKLYGCIQADYYFEYREFNEVTGEILKMNIAWMFWLDNKAR